MDDLDSGEKTVLDILRGLRGMEYGEEPVLWLVAGVFYDKESNDKGMRGVAMRAGHATTFTADSNDPLFKELVTQSWQMAAALAEMNAEKEGNAYSRAPQYDETALRVVEKAIDKARDEGGD